MDEQGEHASAHGQIACGYCGHPIDGQTYLGAEGKKSTEICRECMLKLRAESVATENRAALHSLNMQACTREFLRCLEGRVFA